MWKAFGAKLSSHSLLKSAHQCSPRSVASARVPASPAPWAFIDIDSFSAEHLLQLSCSINAAVGKVEQYVLYSSTPTFTVDPSLQSALGTVQLRVVSSGSGLTQPTIWQIYSDVVQLVVSRGAPGSVCLASKSSQLNVLAEYLSEKGIADLGVGNPTLMSLSAQLLQRALGKARAARVATTSDLGD
eukprot:RCo010556